MGLTRYDRIGEVYTADTIGAEIARQRVERDLNRTVLHHSSSPAGAYKGLATVKGFSDYHRKSRGWRAIGYHWVVGPDGRIFAGRKMQEVGAHAGPKGNPGSVGVCLVGDFQHGDMPTPAQKAAFAALHEALRAQFYGGSVDHLRFHRDYMATDCPGKLTKADVLAWSSGPVEPDSRPAVAEAWSTDQPHLAALYASAKRLPEPARGELLRALNGLRSVYTEQGAPPAA